jgi:hypothetical protein
VLARPCGDHWLEVGSEGGENSWCPRLDREPLVAVLEDHNRCTRLSVLARLGHVAHVEDRRDWPIGGIASPACIGNGELVEVVLFGTTVVLEVQERDRRPIEGSRGMKEAPVEVVGNAEVVQQTEKDLGSTPDCYPGQWGLD